MVASLETLQDLAVERQLQPATLERVIRLIDIFDAFGADALIGPRIALKGGTALYGLVRMPSVAIGSYQAATGPVLDIHEIVAGKMVALVTRRAARDLFDAPLERPKTRNGSSLLRGAILVLSW